MEAADAAVASDPQAFGIVNAGHCPKRALQVLQAAGSTGARQPGGPESRRVQGTPTSVPSGGRQGQPQEPQPGRPAIFHFAQQIQQLFFRRRG